MSKGTTLVISALLAVVMAVLMTVLVLRIASNPKVKNQLVQDTFSVGDARRLAPRIDRNGPLLLQDPGGGGVDIAIVHAGKDPQKGWTAVDLRSPAREHCTLRLHRVRLVFLDPCTHQEFEPTDQKLLRYPVRVRDGRVLVDVRAGSKSPRS